MAQQKPSRTYAERAEETDASAYVVVAGAVQHALQWVPHKNPITLAMGARQLLEESTIPELDETTLKQLESQGNVIRDSARISQWYKSLKLTQAAYGSSDEDISIRGNVNRDNLLLTNWSSKALRPAHYLIQLEDHLVLGIRGMLSIYMPVNVLTLSM
eukprot:gb/GECG01013849.1/.p1 GENE.gb/GECG01013849.1/~~gb/GECG01013849.1/.p1  ORF type:complete len:158 (+),score=20.41 gb/GECG01013849.1/:1-474(+)